MTRLRIVVCAVGALVIGLGIVLAVSLGSDKVSGGSLLEGRPAPLFSAKNFSGTTLSLSSYRGRVVVINYWNEWCAPCIEETPSLVALHTKYSADDNVAMIGILHEPHTEKLARAYAKDHRMNYDLVVDPTERIALDYQVTGQPETFVLDRAGVVRKFVSGPIDPSQIDALITELKQQQ